MTYEERADQVAALAGKRVRLTYRNTVQQVGVVSTHDYGHCIDVRIDGHGGKMFDLVERVEVMGANGRYEGVT